MKPKPTIIVMVGPTASGKTSVSIEAAKLMSGEIISADSRQVYRGMDIGSGKVTTEEMNGIPHHIIDIANPVEPYTVSDFCRDARKAIDEIVSGGKLPIICGGSAFWIYALVDDLKIPEVKPNIELRKELAQKNVDQLFDTLTKLDPRRAKTIDPKNPARLMRAIEIVSELGAVPEPAHGESPYDPTFIGIDISKEKLAENIHDRLLTRLNSGMIEEVEKLHSQGVTWERLQSFGLEYRHIAEYLQNKTGKEKMVATLERAIIDFSRRQMTWWKKDKRIVWLKKEEIIPHLRSHFLSQ